MRTASNILLGLLALASIQEQCSAFSPEIKAGRAIASLRQNPLYAVDEKEKTRSTVPPPTTRASQDAYLDQATKDGYTVKQRLREEVESPFRKVRLLFLASSAGSALTALYFSGMNTIKALVGGYTDAMPLDEALTSDAINIGAAIICSVLAFREYRVGQANLERIARGGKLAALAVEPASVQTTVGPNLRRLADYRRNYRVLIAGGGEEYITKLARSLNSDQLKDTNVIPEKLQETDVIVVPLLLSESGKDYVVGDTKEFWKSVEAGSEDDRNFDITKADSVIAFPRGNGAWLDYIQEDIKTASGQGFDVLEKGITLTVKKNGRILRRATGLPDFVNLVGAMEVMDGSRFGMPGDSEKYEGA
mmetsp:Transcript_43847/g.105795  ORF Transcript_43847/g.105795 Transcript_43847/m.105795 type:complete len:363 (+) Transcript_43847:67-1155(+)|eukprot:CAMPEP_0113628154 /NCGR_PEP_ID=MMETSP0017_2-20120614/14588_1 /TAXON_ID=2856 /ORGANISM="Cylindrotheca closterium" /LENGTH=362 /DNA_ID=CAMNT_0000538449 /DNA_START=67 /DNA_END=1155 /DNA_ORIENTATION=+ /assembly_acc=CAM_ASM_000147